MDERRKSERHRSLKRASIVFSNRLSTIDCIVRNLSATGALLQMESTLGVPNHFTLKFHEGGGTKECVVKWRREDRLGVTFVDAAVE
jgi:hypothetical protein